jgi:hypothetical protein
VAWQWSGKLLRAAKFQLGLGGTVGAGSHADSARTLEKRWPALGQKGKPWEPRGRSRRSRRGELLKGYMYVKGRQMREGRLQGGMEVVAFLSIEGALFRSCFTTR